MSVKLQLLWFFHILFWVKLERIRRNGISYFLNIATKLKENMYKSCNCPKLRQGSSRLSWYSFSLNFDSKTVIFWVSDSRAKQESQCQNWIREWNFLSLDIKTKCETEKIWVSKTRQSPRAWNWSRLRTGQKISLYSVKECSAYCWFQSDCFGNIPDGGMGWG